MADDALKPPAEVSETELIEALGRLEVDDKLAYAAAVSGSA